MLYWGSHICIEMKVDLQIWVCEARVGNIASNKNSTSCSWVNSIWRAIQDVYTDSQGNIMQCGIDTHERRSHDCLACFDYISSSSAYQYGVTLRYVMCNSWASDLQKSKAVRIELFTARVFCRPSERVFDWHRKYTVSQKSSPFYFSNNSVKN